MKGTRQPLWGGFAALFAVIATTACQPMQSASVSEDRATDQKELIALLGRWEDAWNSHDMHALAALFHEDAVWVLWTGEVWTGRKRFEDGMMEVHKTVYADSIQRERLEELAFVGPDAAVMRFHSELTGDTRYPGKTVQSRKLLVVTRRDGIWRIGWGQNTRFTERPP
jgi:uncharacterized protein (TIGR02246 family)